MERRLGMWSGPRNISTALMRSFSSRRDCLVWDEPFYASWLARCGRRHPLHEEVLASQAQDPREVIEELAAPLPQGKTLGYQKLMSHHILPEDPRGWLRSQDHAFLIREPRAMLKSLAQKLEGFSLEDTGLPQQVEIFDRLRAERAETPAVIDCADILRDPRGSLCALCLHLNLPFDEAMLRWPAGPHERDGVWGKHWYESTWKSTGFGPAPAPAREVDLPRNLEPLAEECTRLYDHLHSFRILPHHAADLERKES